MAKISRLLVSTIKAAITAQAGFHAKHVPAVSSLQGHIVKTTPARYNSSQASLENDISGTDKGFKGHDMLAPFTAGWQSTDVDSLIIEKSEGGNEPRLVDAATKQLNTLPFYHSFWNRTTKPSLDLAKDLLDMFTAKKMAKAFFTNSGSEANDTQVKLVWYYNNALGSPNKKKFIARAKVYHGSTLISASLTGLPALHQKFDLPAPFVLHWRYHQPGETEEEFSTRLAKNLEDLIIKEGPETIAAFIAEPVMGAGGVIHPPATYFNKNMLNLGCKCSFRSVVPKNEGNPLFFEGIILKTRMNLVIKTLCLLSLSKKDVTDGLFPSAHPSISAFDFAMRIDEGKVDLEDLDLSVVIVKGLNILVAYAILDQSVVIVIGLDILVKYVILYIFDYLKMLILLSLTPQIQAVVKKYDILFIADEVICAFGRLGTMFGCDKYNIKPDLVSLAKALSSAYVPIGAVLVSPEISDVIYSQSNKLGSFSHGFTYSGHPVACAVALEALTIYKEDNMVEKVKIISPKFQGGLKAFSDSPIVREIRGTGLILATEFVDNKSPNDPFPPEWGIGTYFGAQCQKNGMLVPVAGDTIMMSPPYIVTPEEVDELLIIYGKALRETEKRVEELKSQK
ncbi:hypothetical protein P3S68_004106 [Capsicum galapagoense]